MKNDLVPAVVAVAIVAAVSFGLAQARPDLPMRPSKPFSPERGAAAKRSKPADSSKVVMHVNGDPVTEMEFASFLQSVPEQQRQFYANPAGRRALAEEIIRIKLLEQEAEKLGLADDPDVSRRIDMMRSQIVAGRALEKLVRERMDAALAAEYERERQSTKSLSHILIAYEGGAAPSKDGRKLSLEQAKEKAAGLVRQLRGGASFAELAKAESDDEQSAAQGGSLGPAKPEMLPEEVAAAVRTLEAGQFSDPVQTQFGVHVFAVTVPTLDELRPLLAQQVQQKIMMETLSDLQKDAKVDLDPKFFPPEPAAPGRPRVNG